MPELVGKVPEEQVENRKRTLPEEARPFMWKPGQSGNPKGRPKNPTITEDIRKVLAEQCPVKDKDGNLLFPGKTNQQVLALSIVKNAIAGKYPFTAEILARIDGAVAQILEVDHTETRRDEFILRLIGDGEATELANRLALRLAGPVPSVAPDPRGEDRK